jgi:hypothetical protein
LEDLDCQMLVWWIHQILEDLESNVSLVDPSNIGRFGLSNVSLMDPSNIGRFGVKC